MHTLVTIYSCSKFDQPCNQNQNVELSLKFPPLTTYITNPKDVADNKGR